MFDIAWSELFLVGAVALVAIGPKDLPKAMLMLGKATRHARDMAHDVRRQWDQLSYEAEIAAKPEDINQKPDAKPHDAP